MLTAFLCLPSSYLHSADASHHDSDAAVLSAEQVFSPLKSNNPGVSRKLYPWYTQSGIDEYFFSISILSCGVAILYFTHSVIVVASRAASEKSFYRSRHVLKSMTFLILSVE